MFPASLIESIRRLGNGVTARQQLFDLITRHEPEGALPGYSRAAQFVARFEHLMKHMEACRESRALDQVPVL